jgi:DNA repair protein SbcD/Mre11
MSCVLVHLSDLHLGFRAFPGTDRGWNLRERDVASAFQRAIQDAARLRPRLVLLSGDLFHRSDPPSTAFLSLTRGLRTLQSLVPGVGILVIAGERDTPLSPADPGPVAVLDSLPGVEAAAGAPRAVRFRELDLHALLAPYRATQGPALPELRPDPEARFNLLLLRGRPATDAGAVLVDPDDWDYVAVGGSHRSWTLAPHIRCPGSLERVGWDPWSEATEEKGFFSYELESRKGEFHPVATRPVVDLAPVRVNPETAEGGTRRLRHLVDEVPGGVAGKLVRIRLEGDISVPEEGVEAGFLEGLRRKAGVVEIRIGGDRSVIEWGADEVTVSEFATLKTGRGGEALGLEPGLHLFSPSSGGDEGRLRSRLLSALAMDEISGEGEPGGKEDGAARLPRLLARGGPPAELIAGALDLPPRSSTGEEFEASPSAETGGASAGTTEVDRVRRELRECRGDVVEAEGEVEARTLEWARDRQEAESRLQAYRDQARELRSRLRSLETEEARCPTCGKLLGSDREGLGRTLREEWEMVVQDGRWWKRRREQLEDRPAELKELENQALRLRARVTELARLLDRADETDRREAAPPSPGERSPAVSGADRRAPAVQALLRRGGSVLHQWSEGRLSGLTLSPSGEVLVVERHLRRPPSAGEMQGVGLALHLGLWLEAGDRGLAPPGGMVLQGLDERGVDPLLPILDQLPLGRLRVLVLLPAGAPLPGSPRIQSVLTEASDHGGFRQVRHGGALLRIRAADVTSAEQEAG